MKFYHSNSKSIARILSIIGFVLGVLSLITTVLSGMLLYKLVRYLNTAQRALPKMEKAASLYIQNSEKKTAHLPANEDNPIH